MPPFANLRLYRTWENLFFLFGGKKRWISPALHSCAVCSAIYYYILPDLKNIKCFTWMDLCKKKFTQEKHATTLPVLFFSANSVNWSLNFSKLYHPLTLHWLMVKIVWHLGLVHLWQSFWTDWPCLPAAYKSSKIFRLVGKRGQVHWLWIQSWSVQRRTVSLQNTR